MTEGRKASYRRWLERQTFFGLSTVEPLLEAAQAAGQVGIEWRLDLYHEEVDRRVKLGKVELREGRLYDCT